ncbi:hypothetical protein N311_02471, partial [Apaloderma vittatum]
IIHWYQQKANNSPKRILFFPETKVVDDGFQAHRYIVDKVSSQKLHILKINNISPDDTATYYCAYWSNHHGRNDYYKVFGTGTKLVVSDKGSSAPTNSEILQKKHDNQITYVCLIEKFYPEVIGVTWTDGKKEVTDHVVKGDVWKPPKGDLYSVSSWLTVPAENKDNNYFCKYEHETGQQSLPTQVSAPVSQEKECSTYPRKSGVFNKDHLTHRTAYLVYIILLLKSSLYHLIVLFFIYR